MIQMIAEENRVTSGEYGRPQYRVSFYSEHINAHAFATFPSRHDAVGYIVSELRRGMMKRPTLKYVEGYHKNEERTILDDWANEW